MDKTYVFISHTTGKEIEIKAEKLKFSNEFCLAYVKDKIVARFNTYDFSYFVKEFRAEIQVLDLTEKEGDLVGKSGDHVFRISGKDLLGVIERRTPPPPAPQEPRILPQS